MYEDLHIFLISKFVESKQLKYFESLVELSAVMVLLWFRKCNSLYFDPSYCLQIIVDGKMLHRNFQNAQFVDKRVDLHII